MHECLEEIEDERGYRFYLNSKTQTKYKEHPLLIMLIKKINSNFCDVKYSSYRSAMKIIQLKRSLFTFCIPFRCAISIITKHKAGSSQESCSPGQLVDIIHDIFYATEKSGFYIEHEKFDLQNAISVLCNLLWNIFDPKRQNNLPLMELKLAMLILCELPTLNTYHQLIDAHFDIAKDHNNCITRTRFEEFINIFGKMLSYLGEPLYFERRSVNEIVNESFENYPGINGMSQFTFTNLWTSHENTKFSSYTNLFLLLIRFKKSELVIHQTQCTSCNVFPIVGMRFKCQKCKGLSLCFACFGKGFVNNRHSLAHRMFELSTNEKSHGKLCSFFMKFQNFFRRQPNSALNHIPSGLEMNHKGHMDGTTKLIENEHVELIQIDEDIEGEAYERHGTRRGTIRSEVFNNSENLMILQRNLMEKLLTVIDSLKLEMGNYEKVLDDKRKVLLTDESLLEFVEKHGTVLVEQINQIKEIHDTFSGSLSSCQNNKTIKSFTSPTTSLFLPHSSTPYHAKKTNLKEKISLETALCKSINGRDLNKSYVADNIEYSISDVSAWFQTKLPNGASKPQDRNKNLADETFETKVANFRDLLLKVKEIIDDSYSDNKELAQTTANLEKVVAKIIDDEEKKRK